MTDVLIEAGTLQASADTREISGVLVPFGVQGNTNLGRFTVEAGAFTLPKDPSVVTLNVQHDHESPVGRATLLAEKADGIHATFRFADTEDGDAALSEFRSGSRTNLSVEAKGIVLRAGKALAGRIFGAAVVQAGAFPGATLLAADAGELPEDVEPITPDEQDATTTEETSVDEAGNAIKTVTTKKTETGADGTVTETTTTTTVAVTTPEQPEETPTEEGADMPNATVPGTLQASAPTAKKGLSKNQVFALMASRNSGRLADTTLLASLTESMGVAEHSLFAALNDVKFDGAGGLTTNIALPQWIGEVWDGQEYRQKFLPLFSHTDLNSLEFKGYKWNVKPEGGTWAGNKSEVPSNAPSLVPVTGKAIRFAGAHDIAREFQDLRAFGDFSFFDSYYKAMAESYAKWVDETIVLTEVLAGATEVDADDATGLTIGTGLSGIIDGASAVISANATPSFALVETSLWKEIAKMPSDSTLGYLNASLRLTGEEGSLDTFSIQPTDALEPGQVLVGAREAVTVYELPGAPVRVDALDVAHGGIDSGLYGYAGALVNKADALQLVNTVLA